MKKTVLYPFSADNMALLKYLNCFRKEYEINKVVAPIGSGLCGKDVSVADNRNSIGMEVGSDLYVELEESEALFVPQIDREKGKRLCIVDKMKQAACMGKEIICCFPLTKKEHKELKACCINSDVKFLYGNEDQTDIWKQVLYRMNEIAVPVIFVTGMFAQVNNFEIVLSLVDRIRRDGYKVSATGVRLEYNFLGLHYLWPLADFINGQVYGKRISSLITLLNSFLYSLSIQEHLDVLIVDVPGGLINTPQFPNESGVYAYILSQVLKPDYTIITSLFSQAQEADFKILLEEIEKRFGFGVDCMHMSNMYLEEQESKQKNVMEFGYVPVNKIYSKTPSINGDFSEYCLLDEEQMEKAYQNILVTLAGEKE